ncbi:MAG: PIN domain-containing protein [Comamonadaceae bacterium]|nr:MAG: PIN domain-containing protein [Comamonadaceae bacterium]
MSGSAQVPYLAEPPSGYLLRPPLVIDCSMLSAALFQEEARDEALRMMAGRTLHAPTLLDHEIVSVALKKARLGWPQAAVTLALGDYAQQDIELHHTPIEAQFGLAQRYKLSAYDAAYLWLAAELRVPLATFDAKLATAARIHLASLP